MAANRIRRKRAPFGVTLIELLLAIAITSMIALGVASMMTAVSSVAETDREARSALLRSLAVREAMRAYIEESLCVLEISDDNHTVVVWLEDDLSPGLANLSELRLIRFDPATNSILSERVTLPEGWHPAVRQGADVVVTSAMDLPGMFEGFADLSMTTVTTLASGIADAEWTLSDATPRNATRARLAFELLAPASAAADPDEVPATPMLVAFGLPEHRSPDR